MWGVILWLQQSRAGTFGAAVLSAPKREKEPPKTWELPGPTAFQDAQERNVKEQVKGGGVRFSASISAQFFSSFFIVFPRF